MDHQQRKINSHLMVIIPSNLSFFWKKQGFVNFKTLFIRTHKFYTSKFYIHVNFILMNIYMCTYMCNYMTVLSYVLGVFGCYFNFLFKSLDSFFRDVCRRPGPSKSIRTRGTRSVTHRTIMSNPLSRLKSDSDLQFNLVCRIPSPEIS